MRTFAVGVLNFFDNENEVFIVEAEEPKEAIFKALIDSCKTEESKKHQEEWNNLFEFTTVDSLLNDLANQELAVSIPIEIKGGKVE